MWIQFTREIGTAKIGTFAEVDDTIGNNYITLGVATQAPADPVQRAVAMTVAQLQPLIAAQGAAARTELARVAAPLSRPKTLIGHDGASSDGRSFEASHITPGSQRIDRERAKPGRFVQLVVTAMHTGDQEQRQAAHDELTRPWEEGGYGSTRTMVEGTGASGGYATPVLYESQLMEVAAEEEVIIPYAENKPLGARQVEWPALNQYTAPVLGQSAWFGGIQVYRKGETVARTETDLALKKVTMVAQDLTALSYLSRDLLFDAPGFDGYVVRSIGGAIGWRCDWESIQGSGVGQMLGIVNSPAMLLVDRNTNSEILYEDVFTMLTRFKAGARSQAWLTHPYTIYQLYTLQDPEGHFIFIPNVGVATGSTMAEAGGAITYKPAGTLLGIPIFTTEKAPVLGSACDLMLVDRKAYWHGQRQGLEIGVSTEFLFSTDEIAIRAKLRNDGKPGQIAPFYLADGSQSNQVSYFVGTSSTHT